MHKTRDKWADELAKTIKSKFKGTGTDSSYFLDESAVNINDWISTGTPILDLAISNKKEGGLPVGRIIEITGLEGSGKSLMCAHLIADTQKQGGIGIFIDTESAVSKEFFEAVGVDLNNMLYITKDTIEDIFSTIEAIIAQIRSSSQKERLVTIVVDSVAGVSTKQEMEAEFDKDGWATSKAIIISKAMRKITRLIGQEKICLVLTNQLRTKMGVTFGDRYTTSGGRGIGYHSSIRIRLKNMGQLKGQVNGKDLVVGMKVQAHIFKNRITAPHKQIPLYIYFDSGIDEYGTLLDFANDFKILDRAGAWYTYNYTDENGKKQSLKFLSKNFAKKMEELPEIKAKIYDDICDKYIFHYKQKFDPSISTVELKESEDSE